MRWRTTVVLALVLVGLAVFYYVSEVRQAPERERAEAERGRLWPGLEAGQVEEVVVTRAGTEVRLRRTAQGWRLVAPVEAATDGRAVDEVVRALVALRVEREIEPDPARAAEFGLDRPAVEVRFRARGEERRVRLGARSPTGGGVYAQADDRAGVVLVGGALLRAADRPADDFRDRTLLVFQPAEVRALEIIPRQGPILQARRKGPEEWELTAPVTAPADPEQVSQLLDTVWRARIREFVSERPESPAPYGLDRPTRLILWVGEEKTRVARGLRLGDAVAAKRAVYGQRDGEPGVFLLDESVARAVPTTVAGLRDRTVLAFDRTRVERIELTSPKGALTLVAEGGTAWRVVSPVSQPADATLVSQLLTRLKNLRARGFAADDARRAAEFGLDRPAVRVVLWERDRQSPKTLALTPARRGRGPATGAGDEPAEAYALAGGAGPIMRVEAALLEELSRSPQDLRDRSLFGQLDPTAVQRLVLARGAETVVVERSGEGWRLQSPTPGRARAARVNDLLWTLQSLRWRDLVAAGGWDPARYGLDRPTATLTLAGREGQTLAALAVGRREQETLYVRIPGQPELYVLDARALGELPAADDLRE